MVIIGWESRELIMGMLVLGLGIVSIGDFLGNGFEIVRLISG